MIDRRPEAIVRCADVSDVVRTVNFARSEDITVAVRGGGHNGAGLGVCDGGVVIDLSPMKGVLVHPATNTIRAEAGCTQADLSQAAHDFGLAVPLGLISSTGIAGLTLGGGMGYLSRKYGLTVDNLLEANLVLANGRFVTANLAMLVDWLVGLTAADLVTSYFAGEVFDQKTLGLINRSNQVFGSLHELQHCGARIRRYDPRAGTLARS